MFATTGVSELLGLEPDQLIGKSFYYCIAENCLQEAVKCLESAKSNDSIAYLRFYYRNPLQSVTRAHSVVMEDDQESEEDEDGGVRIREGSGSSVEMPDVASPLPGDVSLATTRTGSTEAANVRNEVGSRDSGRVSINHNRSLSDRMANEPAVLRDRMLNLDQEIEERVVSRLQPQSRERNTQSSSGNSTDSNARDGIFDQNDRQNSDSAQTSPDPEAGVEVEAVISCSSDGLVVVLRRAHPLVPFVFGATEVPHYANGLFASPWAPTPVMPPHMERTTVTPQIAFPAAPEPVEAGFMAAIRDVAVFAWSLTGINGSLAQYGIGEPEGEALPPGGLPVWDPNDPNGFRNDAYNGFSGSLHRPLEGMGDPTPAPAEDSSSSEDEVVWKRDPTMSAWRRPKRRAHGDAFEDESSADTNGGESNGHKKRAVQK
jgi:hypothetical protein